MEAQEKPVEQVIKPNGLPEHLKPYMVKPGEVRNPYGRPKSVIKEVMKNLDEQYRLRMSKPEVVKVMTYISSLSVADLKRLVADSNTPGFMAVMASSILGDINNGELKNTAFMLEFEHGKSTQRIEQDLSIHNDTVNPKLLSDDQIRQRLSEIRERNIDEGTFEEVV
jgi:hypothetical protein